MCPVRKSLFNQTGEKSKFSIKLLQVCGTGCNKIIVGEEERKEKTRKEGKREELGARGNQLQRKRPLYIGFQIFYSQKDYI